MQWVGMFPFVGANYITIRLPMQLQPLSGGSSTIEVEAATVIDALDAVAKSYPAVGRAIQTENGTIRAHVSVFVNREHIGLRQGERTELQPGDVVTILPSITGG